MKLKSQDSQMLKQLDQRTVLLDSFAFFASNHLLINIIIGIIIMLKLKQLNQF